MTDYKAIADRLVERGIGEERNSCYWIDPDDDALGWLDAEDFCHSWLVAGACMESMGLHDIEDKICVFDADGTYLDLEWLKSPVAIILAYLEATDET